MLSETCQSCPALHALHTVCYRCRKARRYKRIQDTPCAACPALARVLVVCLPCGADRITCSRCGSAKAPIQFRTWTVTKDPSVSCDDCRRLWAKEHAQQIKAALAVAQAVQRSPDYLALVSEFDALFPRPAARAPAAPSGRRKRVAQDFQA